MIPGLVLKQRKGLCLGMLQNQTPAPASSSWFLLTVPLVIIGADEWGNKDVLGLGDGFRESTRSWRELLLDLKHRGLKAAPKLAVGDGAMG